MRLSTRSIRLAVVAVAAAAAIVLAGCSSTTAQRPVAAVGTAVAAPQSARTADRPLLVAIGDSIAFGKGVKPSEAWPARVAAAHGWRLTDLAVSGSGFVKLGWNNTNYRHQVDQALTLHPDFILISATRNDREQDSALVERNSTELLDALRAAFPDARIIGTTAVWGSDRPPATLTRVDGIVEKAVEKVDGTFLDLGFPLVGHRDLLQADQIHPNAAGQDVVAKVVDSKLAPLNLAL
ncbi:SGNH/GDSL hydrolase family protein [Leifsonia sp. NPDC058248]|uniref:SGNH/GDSL hydrolase family protein n=1 Tax=Leifsonia sp. NPDC058248 TaxID=3346402 RepID=UPI0036DF8DD9